MPGKEEFKLVPRNTFQLVVFTVPMPFPELYAGPVTRYIFSAAGLVNATDARVQTEALETVVLPRIAVSVRTATVKLVAVSNCTQTSMVQV